jgi:hypothetical protein
MKDTVRSRLWVWGHEAGSHNGLWRLPGASRMTPVEGAYYLGVPNALMVVFNNQPEPPFNRLAVAFRPLQQVVWSIVGDSSSNRNNQQTDLEAVLELSGPFPNLRGAIMDDFFHPPDASGSISRVSITDLQQIHTRLHTAPHPLDLWVVLYQHELDLPVAPYLEACDVVTFWTWKPELLPALEQNFARAEALAPGKRKVLGIYLWDYNAGQPVPISLVEHQCRLSLEWLRAGRIDGVIFLASCICDLEIEAVEWVRRWIAAVGDETL